MGHFINIQTANGKAHFALNDDRLLVSFSRGELITGHCEFTVVNPQVLFNGAWNMMLLNYVVEQFEPKFSKPEG